MINILLILFFLVCTVSYRSSFFPLIDGPRTLRLGDKSTGKNLVCNLQYRPRARLVRGTYFLLYIYTVLWQG